MPRSTTTPRLAYAEIRTDERAETCAGFLRRAAAWFAAHGVVIERVMTDNALAYRRSRAWREALAEIGAEARFTCRYRPQTKRQGRTTQPHCVRRVLYAQPFDSGDERAAALPQWLHTYNHHRGHTALGGQPPISSWQRPSGSLLLVARLRAPARDVKTPVVMSGLARSSESHVARRLAAELPASGC